MSQGIVSEGLRSLKLLCEAQESHHRCLFALQNESFKVTRVPAVSWPGETRRARFTMTSDTKSVLCQSGRPRIISNGMSARVCKAFIKVLGP